MKFGGQTGLYVRLKAIGIQSFEATLVKWEGISGESLLITFPPLSLFFAKIRYLIHRLIIQKTLKKSQPPGWGQLTPCDRFCQVKQVASEKIEVAEAKRR